MAIKLANVFSSLCLFLISIDGIPRYSLDKTRNDEERGQGLLHGVQNGRGDGTVPLISLGYMCHSGWQSKVYNPHGMRVITREYQRKSHHKQSLVTLKVCLLRCVVISQTW